ncbi:hypothetical protein [Candidatus Phycosocius spiralis]|uniref:Glycosyltransferase RgtA/B/C/D-like domain-containing protein n=1 Tax=Candidatus Phycosocius spiralis TaxID=2815099 RepID=A0ABQ4PWG0_9PROT|nr:hypothetical protein [Candidatus Phycosocius spiralis]GIU67358.1 hypothetical protein PsB1_1512 [Candidatus Phycosocius spiralis]
MNIATSILVDTRPRFWTRPFWTTLFGMCLAGILAIGLWAMLNLTPTGDIVWRLYVAEQVALGKVIYQDVIEINPPLWFWAALPWHYVGELLHVPAYNVLAIGVIFLAGGALWAFNNLTRDSVDLGQRQVILLSIALSYVLLPLGETGQREHAFLVASLLWTALAAARIEGHRVSTPALLITLAFSAYGFALKHFFVLVPVLIEGFMGLRMGRNYRPIRFETLGLAACAVLYTLALVLFAQDFFTRIVPLVMLAYTNFGPVMQLSPSHRLGFIFQKTDFALVAFLVVLVARDRRVLILGLLVTLAAMVLAIWLQLKGWRYHLLAAQGISVVIVASIGAKFLADKRWLIAAVAGLGLAILSHQAIYKPIKRVLLTKGQPVYPTLRTFVMHEPEDSRISVLSISPEHAFYILRILYRPIISRHYGMWMLVGLEVPQKDLNAEMLRRQELDRVRREYIADLTCRPPDVVIEESGRVFSNRPVSFNTLTYLREDPLFDSWFEKHYKFEKPLGYHQFVWRLSGDRPRDQVCKRQP